MRARLTSIERLTNSRNGNPRFKINYDGQYEDGGKVTSHANTASDASFNYEIGNRGFRVGDMVDLTIGGRGTIIGIKVPS
jgi:hypothetical protein